MFPEVGARAELTSLAAHSRFFQQSRESGLALTEQEKESVLYVLERAYRKASYHLRADFMSRERFEEVCYNLDYTSSPGLPYCRENGTIGDWLGWDGQQLSDERVDRLWWDMQAFLSGELLSDYRVFVKREPHSRSKAESGRWRLIVCPPLFEQVAWTMVFGQGNDLEIDTVGQTPSLQGMYLCGGNWKWFLRLFECRGLNIGMDKSAWDWTAHIELLELDLELRDRLITSGPKMEWRTLARRLYDGAFYHPRLVLSNGQVYEQLEPGIVKSGCVNTISTNSHCQLIAHVLVCLRNASSIYPLPVAVGDDTLASERNVGSPSDYSQLGIVVKELVDEVEFVGHRFLPSGPVPKYHTKHVFRFMECDDANLESFLDSMVRLYAHDDAWQEFWRKLARLAGVAIPSPSYVRFWYDYSTDALDSRNNILMLIDR